MGKRKYRKKHQTGRLAPTKGEAGMVPDVSKLQIRVEDVEDVELTAQEIIGKLRRNEIAEEKAQELLEGILVKAWEPSAVHRILREMFPSLRKSGIRSSGI